LSVGVHTGVITIRDTSGSVAPASIPVTVIVTDEVHRTYLPFVQK
jgi:hypothetical protein